MRLVRIPWREAIKKFHVLQCQGCPRNGGDIGEWYVVEKEFYDAPVGTLGPYCGECAEKLTTGADTARSVTTFYSNTRGTSVVTP